MDAYEISEPSRETLSLTTRIPGHYTARVDPLASKQDLQDHGFYYCDTLIEPYCTAQRFSAFEDTAVSISQDVALEPLLEICHGAFSHGRFHRDFNLAPVLAGRRYDNWLTQLHGNRQVWALLYHNVPAGFIAVNGSRLVLHAIAKPLRGKSLAKYLWTPVCRELFTQGHHELTSSVSASNLAVVNLYATLGFRFRNPIDIYHRVVS